MHSLKAQQNRIITELQKSLLVKLDSKRKVKKLKTFKICISLVCCEKFCRNYLDGRCDFEEKIFLAILDYYTLEAKMCVCFSKIHL